MYKVSRVPPVYWYWQYIKSNLYLINVQYQVSKWNIKMNFLFRSNLTQSYSFILSYHENRLFSLTQLAPYTFSLTVMAIIKVYRIICVQLHYCLEQSGNLMAKMIIWKIIYRIENRDRLQRDFFVNKLHLQFVLSKS